jgi:hypothetical protein
MTKMGTKCSGGNCGISCSTEASSCTSSPTDPDNCACDCIQSQPALTKRVKKISIVKSKRKIKANSQSRYNICFRNVPITTLALSFDDILLNIILIPTNKLTNKVNLTLKKKRSNK